MTLQEKQLAFLEDTVSHYNSGNRATNGLVCIYSSTPTSKGCAIGRHLTSELAEKLDKFEELVTDENIFPALPVELQELEAEFLSSVQKLHDDKDNWDENGISEVGQKMVDIIKTNITTGVYENNN